MPSPPTGSSTQLVGMSATLSNVSELAAFMRAEVYSSDFRPVKHNAPGQARFVMPRSSRLQVELVEYVKIGRRLHRVDTGDVDRTVDFLPVRQIPSPPPHVSQVDPDQLCSLVLEVVPQGSCLVFCPTKKNCQNVALLLSKCLPK